jgi:hypothetical protein
LLPAQGVETRALAPRGFPATGGSLYIGEYHRTLEILRFPVAGGAPERIAANLHNPLLPSAIELPDRRVLFSSPIAGRNWILLSGPAGEAFPFVQTDEETSQPMALASDREIVFLLGPPATREIATASLAEGRIVRRVKSPHGAQVEAIACSPDAKTIYYTASKSLWAMAAEGGAPTRLGAGDSLAADPRQGDLIVQVNERERPRLVRLPASGGPPQEIPVRSEFHLTRGALAPNAVSKDGRIVLSAPGVDSWHWGVAVLDPHTGKMERVSVKATDLVRPGWTADGSIVSPSKPVRLAALWRYRPPAAGK